MWMAGPLIHPKFAKGFALGFIAGVLTTLYAGVTAVKHAIGRLDRGVTGDQVPAEDMSAQAWSA
ncbi:hypothetical protein EBT25_16540 [bacterium]|nr:hypothetical protein [bacterium]